MDSHLSEGIEPRGKSGTECIQCSKTFLVWSQTHLPEQGEHQYSCFWIVCFGIWAGTDPIPSITPLFCAARGTLFTAQVQPPALTSASAQQGHSLPAYYQNHGLI